MTTPSDLPETDQPLPVTVDPGVMLAMGEFLQTLGAALIGFRNSLIEGGFSAEAADRIAGDAGAKAMGR